MKVFISHGFDAEDAAGHQALDALCQQLKAADARIDPFYDQARLQPGYQWAQALHEWLEGCSAAVIFLSKRAVTRDWVRKEATILAWRQACQGKDFQLQVVIWGHLKDDELLQAGYGPLQLQAIQRHRCASQAPAPLQHVVERLVAHAGRLHGRDAATPLDVLVGYLSARLGAVPQPTDLAPLAQAITGGQPDWDPGRPMALSCARDIACRVVQDHYGALASLRGLMDRLHEINLNAASRREVFQMLAPMWVDSESAAPLHPGHADGALRPTVIVALPAPEDKSSLSAYEAEMLVRRANPLPGDALLAKVARPSAMDVDGIRDWVAEKVDRQLGHRLPGLYQDDEGGSRDERLAQLRRLNHPVYVLLRFEISVESLESLAEQLPGFVYVCLPPAAIDQLPDDPRWRQVSPTTPADKLDWHSTEYASITAKYSF